eukprot:7644286-Pyramimonas_sp.AAC.2
MQKSRAKLGRSSCALLRCEASTIGGTLAQSDMLGFSGHESRVKLQGGSSVARRPTNAGDIL